MTKAFTSITGVFLSGVYLLFCAVLATSVVTEDANAIGFGSALILLTAPWSFWLTKMIQFGTDDHRPFYLILAVGAIINATILYVAILLIGKLMRALIGKSTAPQD